METLVILPQQRYVRQSESQNQYCTRNDSPSPRGFESPLARSFGGINCRTFHAGTGILPSPFTVPPQSVSGNLDKDINIKNISKNASVTGKKSTRSYSVPIVSSPTCNKTKSDDFPFIFKEAELFSSSPNSELWAGPAYSKSPPPSSLPIPRFSLRQKRSVSLDLPAVGSGMKSFPIVKSAPSSPTRELYSPTVGDDIFFSPASATKNLRRILHLDVLED